MQQFKLTRAKGIIVLKIIKRNKSGAQWAFFQTFENFNGSFSMWGSGNINLIYPLTCIN